MKLTLRLEDSFSEETDPSEPYKKQSVDDLINEAREKLSKISQKFYKNRGLADPKTKKKYGLSSTRTHFSSLVNNNQSQKSHKTSNSNNLKKRRQIGSHLWRSQRASGGLERPRERGRPRNLRQIQYRDNKQTSLRLAAPQQQIGNEIG